MTLSQPRFPLTGTEPALGHPMEIIVLNDTSVEHPAVCKYCGARYFGAHHH
jgi:uncharacterized Zn-finger protein